MEGDSGEEVAEGAQKQVPFGMLRAGFRLR